MDDNTEVPTDATQTDAAVEAELLARVMGESEFVPDDGIPELDDDEVVNEDDDHDEDTDEDVDDTDEVDEDDDEGEEEDDGSEEETELLSEDEVDWDYKVPVTIDGNIEHVALSDLRKGYATDQHLSAKGRELGETRKELEEQHQAKLNQLNGVVEATSAVLMQGENAIAKEYHDLQTKLDAMDTDDFEYDRVEKQKDRKQKEYWKARNEREGIVNAAQQQQQQQAEAQWNQQVQGFYDTVTDVIPEWTPEYNEEIRKFAVEEVGLPEDFLNFVTDANLVKAMDDFRKLKQGVETGSKKREKAPVKKAPVRKAATSKRKKEIKENQVRERGLREDASDEDQMAFLRQHAKESLGR